MWKAYQRVLLGLISVANRIGQREKMKCNAVTLKASADPMRSSGDGSSELSQIKAKGLGLDTTTLTSH